MSDPARRLATWEDLACLDEGGAVEIVGGEIIEMGRPLARHGRFQAGLSRFISGPFDFDEDPGGWWILIEPDVRLGPHDIVEPDVVGWRRERMPEVPETRPIDVVPDWVCEVRSPSTARHDRLLKAPPYLRAGVAHLWIADPDARVLEAWANQGGAWVSLGAWGDGHRARIPPFEAVELDVGKLFTPLR